MKEEVKKSAKTAIADDKNLKSNKSTPDKGEASGDEEKELREKTLESRKNIKHIGTSPAKDGEEIEIETNITEILYDVVEEALNLKSSDIHIEPEEEEVIVRYRVDGLLREAITIDKNLQKSLIFKIKVMANLRTDEHFAPQDGRISFIFKEQRLDTRISILPTTDGEKIVIRLLTSEGKDYALENLGLTGEQLDIVQKAYKRPYGTILAVGPTGSGKTTTLYSILKNLNSTDVNITTIEDPVEYNLFGVNHIQINTKAGLTFANGLRAILRQDPDIIMVGEIRDGETARIAINAAMTGHLVLSTLHTNDSVTTIPRLIDMGIEPFLVSSTLNVIVAQRLARKLCEQCKKKQKMPKETFDSLKKLRPDIADLIKASETFHMAQGCKECNDSGYKGRIGLYEVLRVNEKIRKIINNRGNADDIFKAAREDGLVLIVEDGVNKVREGQTTIEELIRVTAIKE